MNSSDTCSKREGILLTIIKDITVSIGLRKKQPSTNGLDEPESKSRLMKSGRKSCWKL